MAGEEACSVRVKKGPSMINIFSCLARIITRDQMPLFARDLIRLAGDITNHRIGVGITCSASSGDSATAYLSHMSLKCSRNSEVVSGRMCM